MASPFIVDDLVLLGYEDVKEIDVGDMGIAFSGKAKAGIVESEHSFVYVKTDSTKEDLIQIAKRLEKRSQLYVLRSKSGPTEHLIRSAFGKDINEYRIDELLWARVSELFKAYAIDIADSIPFEKYFIAPRGERITIKDRLDNFLVEYFTKKIKNPDVERLVVLKASAGVGKTTLSRHLVKEFAKKITSYRVIPVYVEAAHWGGQVSSVSDLWDIIQLSLQNFDGGSGISKNLFEAALKRGLILFIFDGFDELCANPKSNISAAEVIETLRDLASDSDAMIVVTTRSAYWQAEIGDDPDGIYSIELLPFNPQQAKEYIKRFFENDHDSYVAARQFYDDIVSHGVSPRSEGGARSQFWTLPIAVSMICEAVKTGVSRKDVNSFSVEELLVAICDRETKRQNLGISGKRQFSIFEELALLDATGAPASFERDDLLAAGVPDGDLAKLNSHPLLRVKGGDDFTFSYDFIAPFLRALAIADAVKNISMPIRASVLDAMRAEENGKGFQIEHASSILSADDFESVINLIKVVPKNEKQARSFLVHLLLRRADFQADIKSSNDRANVFLESISEDGEARVVKGLKFIGSFERLDLSKTKFIDCEFVDVSFKNVNFNSCVFSACRFDGEIILSTAADSLSFSSVVIDRNCEIRGAARVYLEPLLGSSIEERDELIKDLLEAGLSKFWHNGKFKSSIRKADWKKGPLGKSQRSDAVLDVLKRCGVLSKLSISGVHEGGWVFNRDSISDLQNFMDHRQLSGSVRNAFDELQRIMKI